MHELAALNVEIASRAAVAVGGLSSGIDVPRPASVEAARAAAAARADNVEGENPYSAAMSRLMSTRRVG